MKHTIRVSYWSRSPELRFPELLLTSSGGRPKRHETPDANCLTRSDRSLGHDASIDADALGFLFMAPLIYFRVIEWATGRRILDLDDDRLIAAWTTLFEPVFTSLVAANKPEPAKRKTRPAPHSEQTAWVDPP